MSDLLQIDHHLARAIAILEDDAGVTALGCNLIERGDLEYYSIGGLSELAANLPAIIVGVRDAIIDTADEDLIEGSLIRPVIPIRVVFFTDYGPTDTVMEDKATAAGAIHGAFADVHADTTTSWTAPLATSQVFYAWPSGVEMHPQEEDRIRVIQGAENVWAIALTVNHHSQTAI